MKLVKKNFISMEAITHFAQQSMKKSVPALRPGDTVRVHQKIREGNKERIQIFEGVVMAVRGSKAINSSFVVRRIASGVGVERTFPLHSPNVVKVERLKSSKVRQARLYYLRERFGRLARMRGEVRSQDAWQELKDDKEVTIPGEETIEAPSAESVEESESADTAENKEETSEEPTEVSSEATMDKEETKE
jgi:large subunit ribosomal protein L19